MRIAKNIRMAIPSSNLIITYKLTAKYPAQMSVFSPQRKLVKYEKTHIHCILHLTVWVLQQLFDHLGKKEKKHHQQLFDHHDPRVVDQDVHVPHLLPHLPEQKYREQKWHI